MTILGYLKHHAQHIGENAAIGAGASTINYRQLFSTITQCAVRMHQNRYHRNSFVILNERDQYEFALLFLGLLVAGCWVIPLSPESLPAEVLMIQQRTNARILDKSILNLSDLANMPPARLPELESGIYHLTSGSTGEPKLCIRTSSGLLNEGADYTDMFKLTYKDRIMSLPPIYHSFSLGGALMAFLVAGAYFHTFTSFYPRKVLAQIDEAKITYMTTVPYLTKLITEMPMKNELNFSSLQKVVVGAGVITSELNQKFHNRFGTCLLCNFGSTETGGLISRCEAEPVASIGRPMKSVKVKLCDENGVAQNNEGEIYVKTPSMLTGYFGHDVLLDHEGYFATGDIGRIDSGGNYYLIGRKKNIAKIGGKSVSIAEVEKAILDVTSITDCSVLSMPQPTGDYHLVAFIAADAPIEPADLRKHCINVLPRYKIPSDFYVLDKLPRNELGKIKRKDLEAKIAQQ